MLTIQTTSTTRSSSVITLLRISALTILLVFTLPIDPSIILLLSCGMLYLRNFVFTILVTQAIGLHHLMSYCLLFYFTKSLNPISFLILFLHSLSAIWTDLLVLTLALFIFIHSHFHYSFIVISLTAFLFYGLTSTVSLNKVTYSSSSFCWHFKSSSFILLFTSPHLVSSHFIS